jgi:hypothetical protein
MVRKTSAVVRSSRFRCWARDQCSRRASRPRATRVVRVHDVAGRRLGDAESRDRGRDLDEDAEEEVGRIGVEPGDRHQSSICQSVEPLALLGCQWRSAARSHVTRESGSAGGWRGSGTRSARRSTGCPNSAGRASRGPRPRRSRQHGGPTTRELTPDRGSPGRRSRYRAPAGRWRGVAPGPS